MIRLLVIGIAAATAVVSCGTLADDPTGERSFLPDRGIGPWRIADLEVCSGEVCGEEVWSEIASIDIAHDGQGFIAAAGWRDGHITLGTLNRTSSGWRLELDPLAPTPTVEWQGVDPDIVVTNDGSGATVILFGATDGSAIGYAQRDADTGKWATGEQPLVRATDIGATTVHHPTGINYEGKALLGFTAKSPLSGSDCGDNDCIMIARSTDADFSGVTIAEVALTLKDVDSSKFPRPDGESTWPKWGPLSKLSHPDLGVTPDGLLRIFFTATGPIAFGGGIEPSDSNSSIGYAATEGLTEPLSFVPYAYNPVHNRSYSFIFNADEEAPSVASDGDVVLLLYMEARAAQTLPVIAEHKLGQ